MGHRQDASQVNGVPTMALASQQPPAARASFSAGHRSAQPGQSPPSSSGSSAQGTNPLVVAAQANRRFGAHAPPRKIVSNRLPPFSSVFDGSLGAQYRADLTPLGLGHMPSWEAAVPSWSIARYQGLVKPVAQKILHQRLGGAY